MSFSAHDFWALFWDGGTGLLILFNATVLLSFLIGLYCSCSSLKTPRFFARMMLDILLNWFQYSSWCSHLPFNIKCPSSSNVHQHQMSSQLPWLPMWENNLILCLQETVPHLKSLLPWPICLNTSSHSHLQWNRQWRQTLWDLWWYSLEKLVWINIIENNHGPISCASPLGTMIFSLSEVTVGLWRESSRSRDARQSLLCVGLDVDLMGTRYTCRPV